MALPPDNADTSSPNVPFAIAARIAAAQARYHRAQLEGAEHLPGGPALVVANHGLYGLDTPVFFYLVWRATGRAPVGLAERYLCALPPMRAALEAIGGVLGTRENALRMLGEGRLVVCYPGGAREVFKAREARHRLAWERALGWVRVAQAAQVPIVPVAGAGIDDTYRVVAKMRPLALLAGHEKYAVPLAVGLGAAPLPARFRFRIGAPFPPPAPRAGEAALHALREQVAGWIETQLEELEDVH
ncbi:1-acyl-sn-glycerol-3-phosphate acyltransferase [Vulgatibacter sp.]|uniref:1-acyl-sn-glycerol-3-phosphate acyltransferase n=1 Tax=Vulgatibacter sp. TaxID=1971226 RepID=UPI00356621FB